MICLGCPPYYFKMVNFECISRQDDVQITKSLKCNGLTCVLDISFNSAMFQPDPLLFAKFRLVYETDDEEDASNMLTEVVIKMKSDLKGLTIDFKFRGSISEGKLFLRQSSTIPVLFNDQSYIQGSQDFMTTDLYYLDSPFYKTVVSMKAILVYGTWALMFPSTLLGSAASSYYGPLMLKVVARLNILSNMNGKMLYASDYFLKIVGKVALPIPVENYIATSPSKSFCKSPRNFSKVRGEESFCDIFSNYGKSMVWFSILMAISLTVRYNYVSKYKRAQELLKIKKKERNSERELDQQVAIPEEFVLWKSREHLYGLRLLLIIFTECSPILLEYAILNILSSSRSGVMIAGTVVSFIIVICYIGVLALSALFVASYLEQKHYCDLRQTDLLLQNNEVQQIIADQSIPEDQKPAMIKGALEGLNFKRENFVKKESKLILGQFANEIGVNEVIIKKKIESFVKNYGESYIDLEKCKVPVMSYLIDGYKKTSCSYLVFTLPPIELIVNLVCQFVMVRFSGYGFVQVYIICLLETMLLCYSALLRPYATVKDYWFRFGFRLHFLVIGLFKMMNVDNVDEVQVRQGKYDSFILVIALSLYLQGAIIAAIYIFKGYVTFKDYRSTLLKELNTAKESKELQKSKQLNAISKTLDESMNQDLFIPDHIAFEGMKPEIAIPNPISSKPIDSIKRKKSSLGHSSKSKRISDKSVQSVLGKVGRSEQAPKKNEDTDIFESRARPEKPQTGDMVPYPPVKPASNEQGKKTTPFQITVSKPEMQSSQLRSFMGESGNEQETRKPKKQRMVAGWTEDDGRSG